LTDRLGATFSAPEPWVFIGSVLGSVVVMGASSIS
jgi:hypothetical protein